MKSRLHKPSTGIKPFTDEKSPIGKLLRTTFRLKMKKKIYVHLFIFVFCLVDVL